MTGIAPRQTMRTHAQSEIAKCLLRGLFGSLSHMGGAMRVIQWIGVLVLAIGGWQGEAFAQQRPVTINDLVQPNAVSSVVLSPDGGQLAYLERTEELTALTRRRQKLNDLEARDYLHRIRVVDLNAPESDEPRLIEVGTDMPFWLSWAGPGRLIVGSVSVSIDNDHPRPTSRRQPYYPFYWRIAVINLENGERTILFGERGAWEMRDREHPGQIIHALPNSPDTVLVAAQYRSFYDLWSVSTVTGDARRVEAGRPTTVNWHVNEAGEAVFRLDLDEEHGRAAIFRREGEGDRWRRTDNLTLDEFDDRLDRARHSIWVADTADPDEVLVAVQPDGAERRGVYRYNLETDTIGELFWEDPRYDLRSVIHDFYSGQIIATTYVDDRFRAHFFDNRTNAHYRAVASFFEPDAVVVPVQVVDAAMLLRVTGPQEPGSYYTYRFEDSSIRPIAVENPILLQTRLSPATTETYRARDGQEIQAYVTRPVRRGTQRPALVVMPHGGPELRDDFGFDFVSQYLASEGWMVFQPNFRGSFGYGRAFTEAGHGQWGRLMQDDITDGVRWLIATGQVDPDRICIAGFSYGGYAALAGALMTPDLYRCAVSVAGVSDLPEMLRWEAEEYPELTEYWQARIGDPERDADALIANSPARRAGEIRVPVMLLHGNRDATVPLEQSEIMRDALEAAGARYRYQEILGANHDLDNPISLARTLALMEAFLGEYLDSGPPPADRMSWADLTEREQFRLAANETAPDETDVFGAPELMPVEE